MTSADLLVERGAQRLHRLAGRAAARGDGVGTWLAEELETDAAFLRRLKPSLIAGRMRAAKNGGPPAEPSPAPPPSNPNPEPPPAPSAARKPKSKSKSKSSGGPSPWLFVGAALVGGIVVAKVLDWRGHAHPRD
jgi:hypothetical protein